MSNVFLEFIQNAGLYDEIEISKDNISDLCELMGGYCKIQTYCHECKKESVFDGIPIDYYYQVGDDEKYQKRNLGAEIDSCQKLFKEESLPWKWRYWDTQEFTRDMTFAFKCAMNSEHIIRYNVVAYEEKLVKIGQYPSIADFDFVKLKEFEKVVGKAARKELGAALGLYANGVGIGSYVYLRRVFENIVNDVAKEVEAEGMIKYSEFIKLRMDQKIESISDYLPKMIVETKQLYGILSKGVHELCEEACRKYFPILRDCIFIILKQSEEKRGEKMLEKSLKDSVSRIAGELI